VNYCFIRCKSLYNGLKNFYNSTTRKCDAVINCPENTTYDFQTNSCNFINVNGANILIPDSVNSTILSTNVNITLIYTKKKMVCVNGELITTSNKCNCTTGWTFDPKLQNVSSSTTYDCTLFIDSNKTLSENVSSAKNSSSISTTVTTTKETSQNQIYTILNSNNSTNSSILGNDASNVNQQLSSVN